MSCPEEVGPQVVARDAGFILDLINAGQRNALLRPASGRCLVHVYITGKVCQSQALGFQEVG